ncbi:Crp/Fnr family transcriptional regulator [Methylorubrum populi]|jgi:CRP-like cAMP-binding protein|uniref:Crp/Fnr family transcriptional regulator n=1 Tax=Methylorubrum rhodesianum TaxID=29427 RepID=A0ABU9Z8A9_9HYPH|nr:Crp/Fnr family transcriptional regulator [Methylorubrum rhodesianum]MBK3402902.1 Crp/Fnr family transcriptional regulator [Methylorubrum rhodesianum]MBY0143103.1 Crp/Fnr family transcriptional regulator [Methylorubrum populi]HEV2541940.1 Crp/Fnr family transcriptional regulator [Methylobacterium sp.]
MNQALSRSNSAQGALFTDLDGVTAEILLNAASQRQFPAGATLFHQGDAPSQLFQVGTGLVRLTRVNPEGEQTTLRFMGPGDLVGCVAVFRQFPFPATATASKPTTVLSWGAAQILDLLRRYPTVSANALDTVGDRAREMVDRLAEMTDKSVEARVASVLLRLVSQVGRNGSTGLEIGKPVTRKDVSEMAGVSYFTVSRILGDWQRQGLVRLGRARIVALDPRRLAQVAT